MDTKTLVKKAPPVLDKRTVLLSHLQAILQTNYIHETAATLCDEVEKREIHELEAMLNVPSCLERFACQTLQRRSTSKDADDDIGEELFTKVANLESELCAQITGMLLELDPYSIQRLLSNPALLGQAVHQAKYEYLKEKHPELRAAEESNEKFAETPATETENQQVEVKDLANTIYQQVEEMFPVNAAKITGMLLELDEHQLHQTIDDTELLDKYVIQARHALKHAGMWMSESNEQSQ